LSEKFNPKDHLRTITRHRKIRTTKGEQWVEENHQYLDVKYRLLWFRQIYPEGFIQTTELEVTDKLARIEATVYDRDPQDGGKRLAVSRRQIFAADFRDYVEKAETQSVGRALAVAGFGTQFCDDLDEENTVADSPVDQSNIKQLKQHNQAKKDNPASNMGSTKVYQAAARKGLTNEDTNILIQVKYQQNDASQLTEEEITEFIEGIEQTPQERLHNFLARYKATMAEQDSVA